MQNWKHLKLSKQCGHNFKLLKMKIAGHTPPPATKIVLKFGPTFVISHLLLLNSFYLVIIFTGATHTNESLGEK